MYSGMVRRLLSLSAIFAVTTFGYSAYAATDSAQMSVTATVESGCALTGGSLNFGTYVAGQSSDLDILGSINFSNCGPGTLTFGLDEGLQPSGGNRFMASGNDLLQYEIYRNASRSAIWGNSVDDQHQSQLFTNQNGSVDVYGRIPANQSVPAGNYTDTVTITLAF